MRKYYSQKIKDYAVAMYNSGFSFNVISKRLAVSPSTIWRWIKVEGLVKCPERHWLNSEKDLLNSLWPIATKEEILNNFPTRTWNSLRYKASELGIRRDIYFDNIKNCILDFSCVDTEEKAYILGFIAADGSVRSGRKNSLSMKLALAEQDLGHLEKLRDILCPSAVIRTYKKKKESHQDLVEFQINDTEFCRSLALYGVTPKKAKTLQPPITLLDSLTSHFIRGLFDGDGSFWHNNKKLYASIDGTEVVVTWINERFRDVYMHKCNVTKAKGSYRITYGASTAAEFARYIYRGAVLYMDRKYNKVKELL